MIEPGLIGGLLLIAGAWVLYRGQLMWSVGFYFFADLMWVWLAYKQGDYFGTFAITLGMMFGLLVFLKSHRGEFVRTLHAKKEPPKESPTTNSTSIVGMNKLQKLYDSSRMKHQKILLKFNRCVKELNKLKKKRGPELDKTKLQNWSKRIRKAGKCDICQSTEDLTAHHLWDKKTHFTLMFQDENGVCLCKSCHNSFHKHYSSANQVTPNMYQKFKIQKQYGIVD